MRSATPPSWPSLPHSIAHELMESERRFRQDEADADRRVASPHGVHRSADAVYPVAVSFALLSW